MDRSVHLGSTQAQLDSAYDNRAHVRDSAACLARWAKASAAMYQSTPVVRDLRYGSAPRQRLDWFPARRRERPTLFFIHGGGWYRCEKEDEAFVAGGPLAHDINVANIEYSLCPEVSLDQMVAEIHSALNWLRPRLEEFGADPRRFVVAGSSAGAHLAAMTLQRGDVTGALLISGIYDLEPIRLGSVNGILGLDSQSAHRNSPIRHIPATAAPVCFAVGADELPEMIRQTHDYCHAWKGAGLPGWQETLSATDHFTIMDELERPDGRLTAALLRLCGE